MKKDKQWQKPNLGVMKQRNAKKVIGSSSKGNVRYSKGIGPTPAYFRLSGLGIEDSRNRF
jgi:hypothetical protein